MGRDKRFSPSCAMNMGYIYLLPQDKHFSGEKDDEPWFVCPKTSILDHFSGEKDDVFQ